MILADIYIDLYRVATLYRKKYRNKGSEVGDGGLIVHKMGYISVLL